MRASSLPRNGLQRHGNLINSGYGSLIDVPHSMIMPNTKRLQNQDLNSSDAYVYNPQEVIRTEGDAPIRSSQMRSSIQPYQGISYLSQQRTTTLPADNWEEFITIQGTIASLNQEQRMKQDKLRTVKYREALDQMVHQERNRKLEKQREYKEPPKQDYSELQALTRLEKIKELEEKKQYSNELKQMVISKAEKKRNEHQNKYIEELENKKTIELIQRYEQYIKSLEDPLQKISFEEYKRMVQLKERENQEDLTRDQEYTDLKTKEFIHSKVFPNQDLEKKRRLEEYINQAVRQKQEQDALEILRRQEASRRHQMDTFAVINQQKQEKYMQRQKEQLDRKEEYQNFLENQRMLGQIEVLKKEHEANKKRDYIDVLKHQAQTKQEAKLTATALTTAEKVMNFRRPAPENLYDNSAVNSLNMNGTCYERNLQLKYIDRWLTK